MFADGPDAGGKDESEGAVAAAEPVVLDRHDRCAAVDGRNVKAPREGFVRTADAARAEGERPRILQGGIRVVIVDGDELDGAVAPVCGPGAETSVRIRIDGVFPECGFLPAVDKHPECFHRVVFRAERCRVLDTALVGVDGMPD